MSDSSKAAADPLSTLIPLIATNDHPRLKSQLHDSPFRSRNFDFTQAHLTVDIHDIESRYRDLQQPYKFVLPQTNLTVLHICAIFDSLECFLLLQPRFPPSNCLRIKSADSYTPLHYACLTSALEIASYLVGEDPDQRRLSEHDLPHTRLALAAQSHSHRIIALLFDDFPLPFEGVPQARELALRNHDRRSLRLLLQYPFPCEALERPPLVAAVLSRTWDAVILLLEEGCDPHQADRQGRMALEIACEKGGPPVDVVRDICRKMGSLEPHATRPRTGPVHWMCKRRDPEIADIFLEYKIILDRVDEKGYQGTYYLIGAEDEAVAVLMLEKLLRAGYDVNTVDKKGRTLLEIVCDRNCWEVRPRMVEWLIRNGANERSVAKALADERYKRRVAEILKEMEQLKDES